MRFVVPKLLTDATAKASNVRFLRSSSFHQATPSKAPLVITFPRIVALLVLMFTAGQAFAQNLLFNPGFDSDISNWSPAGPASIAWSMLDSNGSPGSGSVQLTNASAFANDGGTVQQCLPMPARYAYVFSGKVFVPSGPGQSTSNSTRLDIRFASNPACTQLIGGNSQIGGSATQLDTWQTVGPATRVAPVGTVAVLVRGLVTKTLAGGSVRANFDDIRVESDTFFIGSFE